METSRKTVKARDVKLVPGLTNVYMDTRSNNYCLSHAAFHGRARVPVCKRTWLQCILTVLQQQDVCTPSVMTNYDHSLRVVNLSYVLAGSEGY